MRKLGFVALAGSILAGMSMTSGSAQAGDRRVCWNPPDAVIPGYVPCGPLTGLAAPRRVDGTYGVHPDEWFYNLPISPPGIHTGSNNVGTPPGWDD
jgi:hypothetical protein